MTKRIFSLLLAMVMLFTLSAVAVSAEDVAVEDVPVEDVPVATGINITKPSLPEYYVTSEVANNFPSAKGSLIGTNSETYDPGIAVNPDEYAIAEGGSTVALEEGKATLTFSDVTVNSLLRLIVKTDDSVLSGANYITFHIDTTNLSGTAYFNLRLNNPWNAFQLTNGAKYYFLPDATEENPSPKKVSFVVGDTSFEGFTIPNGLTGTFMLPLTSFAGISTFDKFTEWDSITHTYHQNTAIYLENKREYDGGAVAGDSVVFSNLCWVKEDSVAINTGYNAEYVVNDYSATETGKTSFTAINGWDNDHNWQSANIGKAFDNSFEALKFDLDYSEFTVAENGNTIKFYYEFRDNPDWACHQFWASGEVYLIWENGKVVTLDAGGSTKQIPAGFKGSVIIPFSSFGNDNNSNSMDIFSQGQNEYKLGIYVYGNESETALTAYVDNMSFLTTYNATDLVSIRAQLMDEVFEETEKTVDLNGNGVIDAVDIVKLKKIVAWAA